MKKCSKCLVEKPLSEFAKANGGRVAPRCKKCTAKYQREYYAQKVSKVSVQRAADRLTQLLNVWSVKANREGLTLSVHFDNGFVVSLKETK